MRRISMTHVQPGEWIAPRVLDGLQMARHTVNACSRSAQSALRTVGRQRVAHRFIWLSSEKATVRHKRAKSERRALGPHYPQFVEAASAANLLHKGRHGLLSYPWLGHDHSSRAYPEISATSMSR